MLGSVSCWCESSESEAKSVVISKEEMQIPLKIVKILEDWWVLLKEVIKAMDNETEEQRSVFITMLLATFGASPLKKMLSDKEETWAGDGLFRTGNGIKKAEGLSMLPKSLTNSEIQTYYWNKSKFNGIYSRNNLPKVKSVCSKTWLSQISLRTLSYLY